MFTPSWLILLAIWLCWGVRRALLPERRCGRLRDPPIRLVGSSALARHTTQRLNVIICRSGVWLLRYAVFGLVVPGCIYLPLHFSKS
jgi:hypothetical protein